MAEWVYEKPDNLVEMWERSQERFADRKWLGTKDAEGQYQWITYREGDERVTHLRGGLASLGVGAGDTVAIIAGNRVEWALCCYATYGLGARFVPMYEQELLQIWKYIISDSGTKVLFVSTQEIRDRIQGWIGEIEALEHVVLIDGEGEGTLAGLEQIGRDAPVDAKHPAPTDIAGLIYTSGTTGEPKGVLLSHGNLTNNVIGGLKAFTLFGADDRSLSFLPWAHAYGQIAELHGVMLIGASTGFAESPKTIVDDLALVQPTMLFAVPRVFNKVYARVQQKIEDTGGFGKILFEMGVAAGKRKNELAREGGSSWWTNLKLSIADRVVFSKIRQLFGGRMKFSFSSSAALSPDIIEFFWIIGIPIYEGWGMTELSPLATICTPEAVKFGSAGKAIENVRLVIDEATLDSGGAGGELIVYGPNVMQGYHNKPEATAETLTADGGLRTGDRAKIDDEGFLFITGRIKEQYKLENGKFVYPASMEEEMKLLGNVEQAMIFGLNKPYNVSLVVPDFLALSKWAAAEGLPSEPEKLVAEARVQELLAGEIAAQLKGKYGGYEIPRKFHFIAEAFTPENGLLTPTQKLKRIKVLERYQDDIDAMYAG